jgi:hypothetical protein
VLLDAIVKLHDRIRREPLGRHRVPWLAEREAKALRSTSGVVR